MNDKLEYSARKKVKQKKNWYFHFSLWLAFSIAFLVFNRAVTPEFYWSLIISFCWGIGLSIHAFRVLDSFSFYQKWDAVQFEKEMHKLERSNHYPALQESRLQLEPGRWNRGEFV